MSTNAPQVPDQCRACLNFNTNEMICKNYDFLIMEGDRKDVTDCPSYIGLDETSKVDDLHVLADYIREDSDGIVERRIQDSVNRVLNDYDNKFKVMVVGIARRKISAMVKMVDIIDILLGKLSDIDEAVIDDMTPGQLIKLLQELNFSVNQDLSFVMSLIKPDSDLKNIQMFIDNSNTINMNGASNDTELKAEEILKLTGTSRDKIREAFDAILHNVNVADVEDVHVPTENEQEYLDIL